MTVNLGPVFGTISGTPVNPQPDGFGYNPRCLRRDVNVHSAAVTKTNYTYDLITNPGNADIYWFENVMQGLFSIGEWGVHTGGHFTIGGDPGGVSEYLCGENCSSSGLTILTSAYRTSSHLPVTQLSIFIMV